MWTAIFIVVASSKFSADRMPACDLIGCLPCSGMAQNCGHPINAQVGILLTPHFVSKIQKPQWLVCLEPLGNCVFWTTIATPSKRGPPNIVLSKPLRKTQFSPPRCLLLLIHLFQWYQLVFLGGSCVSLTFYWIGHSINQQTQPIQ